MESGKKKKSGSGAISARLNLLRSIPQVDEVLQWLAPTAAPPILIKQAVRQELESWRQKILEGKKISKKDLAKKNLQQQIQKRLQVKLGPNFKRVINATGVVIHTNLGRSILPDSAREALVTAATCYSNLEFDLATGKRGSRYALVEQLLCDLTGAEAALVVNNNAAAVLLALDSLAKGREVIVSRGQLVEIGGSFRVPEVMAKSGAQLVEVGATNRTHLHDYEGAISTETSVLLKVHASNFKMVGFTKEVSAADLVELANRYNLLVMEDLGSGCLIDLSMYGLRKEPTVQETVKAGVDVVTFSGDKLLGGPQAGLIVGKSHIIDRIKKNQLNRALRIDKFTLAALETVLRLYYDYETVISRVPTLAMLTADPEILDRRARRLKRRIGKSLEGKCSLAVQETGSRVGGGALPEENIASRALVLGPLDRTVNELEKNLRLQSLPVIGRIEGDRYFLDMRTVTDNEIPLLADILGRVFGAKA